MQIDVVIPELQHARPADAARTYPVTYNFDHDRVVGRAHVSADRNVVTIELSDPAIVEWIQRDTLLGFSIGKTYIPEKGNIHD